QWLTSSPHKYSNNINELGISNSSYYTFSTEAQDNGYQLKATAKGSQLKDSACLSLTINQHSDKTPSNCWE
ncbi:MAG: type IV pilin protein, partial [Plesiomonas shigelloides]